MTIGRDELIQDYLSASESKALSSIELANELAVCGIDCISTKYLAAQFRIAGWTPYNTGKERGWLAPGETLLSVGISKPANIQFVVARIIDRLLIDEDAMEVSRLHAAIREEMGESGKPSLVNKNMEARIKLGKWEYIRQHRQYGGHNMWLRIAEKKKPDPI